MRSNTGPPLVRFYHPLLLTMEQTIAVILDKAYQRGLKICLLSREPAQAKHLDEFLWIYPANSFLPHGFCGGRHDKRQPILICKEPNDANGATVLTNTELVPLEKPEQFDMVLEFVDPSRQETIAASRERYRFYRSCACEIEYWRQTDQGAWEKR